jgi:hypothetical protein
MASNGLPGVVSKNQNQETIFHTVLLLEPIMKGGSWKERSPRHDFALWPPLLLQRFLVGK